MLDLFTLTCKIDIDPIVPAFVRLLVNTVKVVVPIILIAVGIIDLAKAVTANDDKVMKEATSKLIRRIVYAILIFFVVAIVQLVFNVLGSAQSQSGSTNQDTVKKNDISACIKCFISDGTACSKNY